MRFSDPSERPRARRNPARTAPTERAAPKATADGTAIPLFPNRRERAADGNRTSTEKETKRTCIGTSLTIRKAALRLLALLSASRRDTARSATLLRGRKDASETSAVLLRRDKESSEPSAALTRCKATPRAARKPRTPGTTWSNKHSYAQYHSGTQHFRMLRPRIFTSNPVYP